MDARPFLFLDIDGVVAPFNEIPEAKSLFVDAELHWVSHAVINALPALCRTFEVVWCTQWEHKAVWLGQALDMPHLNHIEFSEPWEASKTWKLSDVATLAGVERAVAWIDDELREDAWQWAKSRQAPTLLIQPNPSLGMTDADIQTLIDFAKENTHAVS